MSLRFWLSIAIVSCALVVSSNAVASVGIEGRIIGGTEAHVFAFPYQVSIRRKSCVSCAFELFASGAIYSRNIIITAASVVRLETPKSLLVVAGSSYRTASEGVVVPVEEIVIHENFELLSLDFDIALLKLKAELPLGEITTVQALKIAESLPGEGSTAVVAGWGQIAEGGEYAETIRQTKVAIIGRVSCQKLYEFSEITENMVCAGLEQGGSDACKGDAGSPLVVSNELVGLVSWGVGCARPNNPGVYTNVVQLHGWIDATVDTLLIEN